MVPCPYREASLGMKDSRIGSKLDLTTLIFDEMTQICGKYLRIRNDRRGGILDPA